MMSLNYTEIDMFDLGLLPLPKKTLPQQGRGVAVALAKTAVVPAEELMKPVISKYGFGIDEFLEEFPSLMKRVSDLKKTLFTPLNDAADCKTEAKRLGLLKEWAVEVYAKLCAMRQMPEFQGKALYSLDLIIHNLRRAFEEELKKTRTEVKKSEPKVYDFGLKDFLGRYSGVLSKEAKNEFTLIHQINGYSSSKETSILKDLMRWALAVQKELKFNRDAQKMVEAIKFRLRVRLVILHVLARTNKKEASLVNKKVKLEKELKNLEDKQRTLRHQKLWPRPPVDINSTLQETTSKTASTEAEIKKIEIELIPLKINKPLIESVEKLAEASSVVMLPEMIWETSTDKELIDAIIKYKEKYDDKIKKIDSTTVTATMEIESVCIEVVDTVAEQVARDSFLSYTKRSSDEKFGVKSPSPLKNAPPDIPVVQERAVLDFPSETQKELNAQIKKKETERKALMQDNKSQQESMARCKNQILANLNLRCDQDAYSVIPASLKQVGRAGIMSASHDGYLAAMESGDEEQKSVHLRNAANIGIIDRLRLALGFQPSVKYQNRQAAVKKYFDLSFVKKQILDGLNADDDSRLTMSINLRYFDNNLDGFPTLKNSYFESKRQLEKNQQALKNIPDELTQLYQSLADVEQPSSDEKDVTHEKSEENSCGFSFDDELDKQQLTPPSLSGSLSQ